MPTNESIKWCVCSIEPFQKCSHQRRTRIKKNHNHPLKKNQPHCSFEKPSGQNWEGRPPLEKPSLKPSVWSNCITIHAVHHGIMSTTLKTKEEYHFSCLTKVWDLMPPWTIYFTTMKHERQWMLSPLEAIFYAELMIATGNWLILVISQ